MFFSLCVYGEKVPAGYVATWETLPLINIDNDIKSFTEKLNEKNS